jgi:hypothetical protein
MTLYDACQLRAAANSWRERIRRDNAIDPDARRRALKALLVLRGFAADLMESPQTGECADAQQPHP